MKFQDRTESGQKLATALRRYANRPDVIVLGLPRGGIPVAYEVAKELGAPLDVYVVRKLGVPKHEELAMGAIATGGVRYLNDRVVNSLRISPDIVDQVAFKEQRELERREQVYRDNRPAPELRDRIVILVDDGLATGATMQAAIAALHHQHPAKIIGAVPVAAPEVCEALADKVDEMICAETPQPFYAVGLWYKNFSQTTDDEVRQLLKQAERRQQHLAGSAGDR
ncbi:MAG TPA: phosphoribosyltransferase [Elainellaceae cyanobacterium]|jgi:putative phosphoribosyl transferase